MKNIHTVKEEILKEFDTEFHFGNRQHLKNSVRS